MVAFLLAAAVFVAVLLLACVPAVLVARAHPHHGSVRSLLVAAVVAGVFCGGVRAGSARLVEQCEAEGNTSCFDSGATGLLAIVVVAFLTVALGRAWMMHND